MENIEICADRIAAMLVHNVNAVLAETRKTVAEKYDPSENNLYMWTLDLAQINEDKYYSRVEHDDLDRIIRDIREAHKDDTTSADAVNSSDMARQELEVSMSYEGSPEERQAYLFCKLLSINYNKLT